jgi:hypothetical protein
MIKVYLLKTEEEIPRYKIGITRRSISQRIKELKTGNDKEITLVSYFESIWGTKIESTLHYLLKQNNISGEWYELDDKMVKNFLFECKSIHDSYDFIDKNDLMKLI